MTAYHEELTPKVSIGTHNCPECKAPAICHLEVGKSNCWCFTVVKPELRQELLSENDSCLCLNCLKGMRL